MAFPKSIGRYQIQSELGRGGMATVYHALDPRSNREVAIKVLPREMLHDLTFRARFEREIKILVGLEHPHIVTIYDIGDEDGQPYFVMKYMKGGSLLERINAGKLSLQEAAGITEKIARGLAHAHQKGLIHRDLKPDNILFDSEGNPFISDFGIATLSNKTGNLTDKRSIGSPAYMSPEQAQGEKLDPRSDVYSLGVILYQMLSGKLPYSSDTDLGVAYKHVNNPLPEILKAVPNLPTETDQVIKTAMAKNAGQRYATSIELAKALNKIAFGYEGDFAHQTKSTISSFTKTGFAIAVVVMLVAVAGFFLLRNQLFAPVLPSHTQTPVPTFTSRPKNALIETPVAASIAATDIISSPSSVPLSPACPADAVIAAPDIKSIDKFCVKKNPYTTISIPEGATFESVNPEFSCKVENTRNGRSALSCTGKPAYSFDLRVCRPPSINVDLNKCPQDAAFDSAHQCCMTLPLADNAGCIVYKVDIRSCP